MRKLLQCVLFILLSSLIVEAQETESSMTIDSFSESNPQCISYNVIYEGCILMLCSDGEYMFVQLNILHPEMQMRFLMQGLTFYVDPTGRKKEKYSIEFPSAHDVKEMFQYSKPNQNTFEPNDTPSGTRPDILPLIKALNANTISFNIGNKQISLPREMASIYLSIDDECLSYTVLFPIDKMLTEKKLKREWTLGIYSEGGSPSKNNPGVIVGSDDGVINSSNTDLQRSRSQKQNRIKGDNEIRRIMMKTIETWIHFDFSDSCSQN